MLLLFTAAALSLDALALGLSYGLNGIDFPPKSVFACGCASFALTSCAALLGSGISAAAGDIWGRLIGAVMMTGLGAWLIIQGETENKELPAGIITQPELSDIDKSGGISAAEAAITGIALSIDTAVVCAGFSAEGKGCAAMPFFVLLVQFIFIYIGIVCGKKAGVYINARLCAFVGGFAVIIIGLYELTPIFC